MQDVKIAKNSPSAHHRTTLSGYIFPTKAYVDNRKKSIKHQYLLHTFSQYGVLRPTNCWYRFGGLRHPANFNEFRVLASLLQQCRSQPNFARCLSVSWAGTLVHYIYTFLGLLLPQGILPGTKFTLRPNLAFSYIGSVIVRHSSRERQSNFEAYSGGRHLYSAERTSRLALAHILVMVALCNMTLISVISLNVSLSRIFGLHLLILWLSSM